MIKKLKILAPVLIGVAVIGLILFLIGNYITENKIDLYNVDFKNFEFKKNQPYKYEVEIVGDYFYKKSSYGKYNHDIYYYYNAKLKNKYNDNIYVVYEMNEGARINMNKDKDYTFSNSGVIKSISSKMEDSYNDSLNNISKDALTYDIYFTFTAKSILIMMGILFMIFPIFMMIFVLPLSCLVDKKIKFNKEV